MQISKIFYDSQHYIRKCGLCEVVHLPVIFGSGVLTVVRDFSYAQKRHRAGVADRGYGAGLHIKSVDAEKTIKFLLDGVFGYKEIPGAAF